ncbi:MAG TPA: glycosyltransferase [Candidatus Elarobacter sp.]|nr:glycosyltransferase [Candidatus Elarobacter sp.]
MPDQTAAQPSEPQPAARGMARPSVAICVLTYKRNRQLLALLGGLAKLERPDADVQIVVVDNNPGGDARAIVDEFRTSWADAGQQWPIVYVHEPERGIARARNRAVNACADTDFVAFVDDDEVPEPDWLVCLFRVQASTRADVVVGRVLTRFVTTPPKWVLEGRYLELPRRATGTRVNWAVTGNVLIARHLLRRYSPPFDERFNLSGGEDTHFFMRANDDGALMVSADDAIVFEDTPADRTTWRSIMRREYRRGNTLSLCMLDLHPTTIRRVRRIGQGLYRFAQGLGLLVLIPVAGRQNFYRAVHRMCLGAGLLTGLLGLRYEQYMHERPDLAKVHGSTR